MKNPFDNFDEIHCINMDSQPDRWEKCLDEFKKVGIEDRVERFSAIVPNRSPRRPITKGELGCNLSHKEIITSARDRGLKNVFIFEDDIKFDGYTHDIFNTGLDDLQNHIGTEWRTVNMGVIIDSPPRKVTDNLYEIFKHGTTHAYGVNSKWFDVIIDKLNNIGRRKNIRVDLFYSNCIGGKYLIYPITAWQHANLSNITGEDRDSTAIMKRGLEKYII